jgi:hypothetical protein
VWEEVARLEEIFVFGCRRAKKTPSVDAKVNS